MSQCDVWMLIDAQIPIFVAYLTICDASLVSTLTSVGQPGTCQLILQHQVLWSTNEK